MISEKLICRANELAAYLTATIRARTIQRSVEEIRGADVLVLGSAPTPALSALAENTLLVCCNGSAANAKRLGMKDPMMTVVDFELINPKVAYSKSVRSDILTNKILAELHLGILVATQSNSTARGMPEILGAHYDRFISIDRFARRKILDVVSGTDKLERDARFSLCSTGGFAVALSLFLGARSVSIAGFSLAINPDDNAQMHFYDASGKPTGVRDTRNHSMADSALIALSVINGHTIRTRERDFLPLVQNWGNKGPGW